MPRGFTYPRSPKVSGVVRVNMKSCSTCKTAKPFAAFYKSRTRKDGLQSACKTCHADRMRQLGPMQQRTRRRDPSKRAGFIINDTRGSDKKKGFANDLSHSFVAEAISSPCTYCESTGNKMTVDRIDNSIGHIQSNCVPCCLRCNYIKRDMPNSAWLALVPAIRVAAQSGLFEGWNPGPKSL